MVLNNYTEKIERPVRALLLDKERTFWIGTKGNGILKIFDYEVQKNISDCRSEILTTSNSGLGSNAVYCIRESNRNLLWIGDEEGLNFYRIVNAVSRNFLSGLIMRNSNTYMIFMKRRTRNCGWPVWGWE